MQSAEFKVQNVSNQSRESHRAIEAEESFDLSWGVKNIVGDVFYRVWDVFYIVRDVFYRVEDVFYRVEDVFYIL